MTCYLSIFRPTNMNMLTLDFSEVKTENDMHQLLKETFNFPEFYGCNWDAFWNMIYNYIDRNVIVK
jgi:ribonuclease inhibitor